MTKKTYPYISVATDYYWRWAPDSGGKPNERVIQIAYKDDFPGDETWDDLYASEILDSYRLGDFFLVLTHQNEISIYSCAKECPPSL